MAAPYPKSNQTEAYGGHTAVKREGAHMYLGIEQNTGFIYEGTGNPDIPVLPTPSVVHAKIIEQPADWKYLPAPSERFGLVFREDSFDPVSRTRRGRLYQKKEGAQPEQHTVSAHPYDRGLIPGYDKATRKTMFVYMSCIDILQKPNQGLGVVLALGSSHGASAWRIVQSEAVYSGAVMVTLKALSVYGILPELDAEKLEARFRPAVSQALAKVLDSAFKESPGSVVDNCRDAMQVIISSWLAQNGSTNTVIGNELAKVSAVIEAAPHEKICVGNLGKVCAKLHTRNKSNTQRQKRYRPILEEDAELALQALGFTVRDLGWAKN